MSKKSLRNAWREGKLRKVYVIKPVQERTPTTGRKGDTAIRGEKVGGQTPVRPNMASYSQGISGGREGKKKKAIKDKVIRHS